MIKSSLKQSDRHLGSVSVKKNQCASIKCYLGNIELILVYCQRIQKKNSRNHGSCNYHDSNASSTIKWLKFRSTSLVYDLFSSFN